MSNPQHEPTMEEILASIRKIISEDSPAASHEAQTNGNADVLDLTNEVHETHPPDEPIPANTDCREATPPDSTQQEDGLFSDRTRAAVEETVAGLSSAVAPAEHARAPGESVEEAFERAVRETFEPVLGQWLADNRETMVRYVKPVIRDWLDEHFPAMLEKAVRDELARARNRRA